MRVDVFEMVMLCGGRTHSSPACCKRSTAREAVDRSNQLGLGGDDRAKIVPGVKTAMGSTWKLVA